MKPVVRKEVGDGSGGNIAPLRSILPERNVDLFGDRKCRVESEERSVIDRREAIN